MATKLGDAYVALGTKDELDKGLNAAKAKVGGFLRDLATGVTQGIGIAVANGVGNLVRAGIGEIGKATKAASDLNETMSKTSVVFGEATQEVLEWSKTSATALGLSQRAALEAASSFANMFIQMGEGRQEAAGMSSLMVELAADIASFNNVAGGAEDVLQDMASAFRGEYDPIQKYIPIINAAAVEQQALAETGKASAKELTALEKAIAVQTLIMQGAGAATDDFARTLGNVANQERILAAQMENLRASFGQAFVPIYAEILRGLNLIIGQVSEHGEGIVQALATGMVNGIIYLLPAIRAIRDIITYWFKPGSPPRILPDIDKWMTETINVWLSGASKADFGMLRDLGSSIESILRSFVGTGQIAETDLVGRVFGSQAAIVRAIAEWRTLGTVSTGTLEAIRRSAGPAGDSIAGLVSAYFDLERAAQATTKAQEELTRVTQYYDRALSPLQDRLDSINAQQQRIRDNQRLKELGELLTDPDSEPADRRLAQLEIQEIQTRQRMELIEEERDTALDAEKKKLDAAKKEEQAKQDIYDQQQAQLEQQVNNNRLLGEQISLEERLAAQAKAERLAAENKALAEQEKALRELEAEQRKAEAADKARLAELERVYQASLRYNLATADTEGKLALLRLELGRYKEGSEEYFNILTQIAGLEEQLNKEREAGAGGAGSLLPPILPDVESLEVPSWAKELSTKLRTEIDKAFGTEPDFGISIKEGSSLLNRIIGPEPEKLSEVSQGVKNFVGAIDALVLAIQGVTGPLETLAALFAPVETEATKTSDTIRLLSLPGGAWYAAFYLLGTTVRDAFVGMVNLLPLGNREPLDASSPLFGLKLKGAAIGGMLTTGFLFGQVPLITAWINLFQWMVDQLPGSEPKDTSSPLYGLGDRGEAIVNNLWDGVKDAWRGFAEWWTSSMQWIWDQIPDLPPWMQSLFGGDSSITPQSYGGPGLYPGMNGGVSAANIAPVSVASLPVGGTTTTNNSTSLGPINLHFHGPTTEQEARAAADTLLDQLRSKGIRVG